MFLFTGWHITPHRKNIWGPPNCRLHRNWDHTDLQFFFFQVRKIKSTPLVTKCTGLQAWHKTFREITFLVRPHRAPSEWEVALMCNSLSERDFSHHPPLFEIINPIGRHIILNTNNRTQFSFSANCVLQSTFLL